MCLTDGGPEFPHMSLVFTVAVQDAVNGGKVHIVDSSKILIISSLLSVFQFSGLVFEDHVSDELCLLFGE